LCNMGDPESLAEAILMLINDNSLRHKIAERGKELYSKKFTVNELGVELSMGLSSLING